MFAQPATKDSVIRKFSIRRTSSTGTTVMSSSLAWNSVPPIVLTMPPSMTQLPISVKNFTRPADLVLLETRHIV